MYNRHVTPQSKRTTIGHQKLSDTVYTSILAVPVVFVILFPKSPLLNPLATERICFLKLGLNHPSHIATPKPVQIKLGGGMARSAGG